MSVPVDIEGLREAVDARRGATAYLLTVGEGSRPKVSQVRPVWNDGPIATDAAGGSAANVSTRRSVTMLWPPDEPGGYSLIVDGDAEVTPGGTVTVRPGNAVLHRAAPTPSVDRDGAGTGDTAASCGHDCLPVGRMGEPAP